MHDPRREDINLIKVLEAILMERNLTRAGERLGLTQPAVSNRLARLRALYADELIVRRGRSFELTPLAQELLPLVQHAMLEVGRTLELLPGFDPATTNRTFLVSGSDAILSELIGPLQTQLRKEAPGAKLIFGSLPTDQDVDPTDLLRRDLLIAATGNNIPGRSRSLFIDPVVCLADAAHPRLRPGDRFELADLAACRFAVNSLHGAFLTPMDRSLAEAGIQARPAVAVRGFLQLPFIIQGTDLVAFVPERVANRYATALGLVIVDTPLAPFSFVESAYWHPSRDNDPARVWLLDMLVRAVAIIDDDETDQAQPGPA